MNSDAIRRDTKINEQAVVISSLNEQIAMHQATDTQLRQELKNVQSELQTKLREKQTLETELHTLRDTLQSSVTAFGGKSC